MTAKIQLTVLAVCLSSWAAYAMPRIPGSVKGQLEEVNAQRRELVVTNQHERIALDWKGSAGCRVCCLKPGDDLKAYYRKEVGRNVTRQLYGVQARACCK